MQLSVTPWTAAHQTSLFFTSPRVCSTHIHWVGDTIQPSHAPLPTSLPTLSLSQHLSLFQKVGSLHQVAKELDSSCSVSPSNECAELISLGIDWFDFLKDWLIWFLAVQGTLKCLLQHHSSKASILQHLTFIMIQLSYPYMTTGKTLALIRWTFVGKVMSLLFHTPSRFVIAFLPRSKRLLISWLQSPSIGILEPNKIKSVTVSIVPPSICHEVMGLDAMIFGFGMLSFKPTFSLSPLHPHQEAF